MYPLSTTHLQARQPQALHVQSHTLPRHEVHELVQLAVPQRRDVDPVRTVVQLQRRGAQVHVLEEGHYGGALKLQLQRRDRPQSDPEPRGEDGTAVCL